jgi:transcriptional regulator with XRE-family HTH domain
LPDFRHRVGARIAARRQEAGLTQTQLARRIDPGMDGGQVSRWETGASFPTYENIRALARALGVSEEALLCGLDEEPRRGRPSRP